MITFHYLLAVIRTDQPGEIRITVSTPTLKAGVALVEGIR